MPTIIVAVQGGVTMTGMTTDGQEEQVMNGDLHDADDAPHEIEEDTVAMMEELSPQAMQSSPSPGCKCSLISRTEHSSCVSRVEVMVSFFDNMALDVVHLKVLCLLSTENYTFLMCFELIGYSGTAVLRTALVADELVAILKCSSNHWP